MLFTKKGAHKRIKLVSVLLAFIMVIGFMPKTTFTVFAAAPTSYTDITPESSVTVNIASSGDVKHYRFTPIVDGMYVFYSSDNTIDPCLELLNSSGSILAFDDDSGTNYNFMLSYSCEAFTTYYIKVRTIGNSTGSCTLHVDGSDFENIMPDSSASVSITPAGSAKYFKFAPTQSGTYTFYSTNYTADPYGALLDASGNILISDDDSGDEVNFMITYNCTANTTYYVKAYLFSSSAIGSYTLNVDTISAVTPTPSGSVLDIDGTGGPNYYLFNSGRTGSANNTSASSQVNNSYNNNGYDLYGDQGTTRDTIQLGLSFNVGVSTGELVRLSINAYDVDEISNHNGRCHERDYIILVDETASTRTQLSGYLSGQNGTWNTTVFSIDPSNFTVGHTYHFELNVDCAAGCRTDWIVYVRTVSMEYNIGTIVPITGIENADLSASISSSGLVSVDLTANAYTEGTYTLEYKAVCSANSSQYGGTEYSVTIPTSTTAFSTSFNLESGALRGTYEVTVIIKNAQGNVATTRTASASYGYSAVSYNSNGGSQNLPTDGMTYSSGDTVTVKFDYVPSKTGYTFLGWSTDRYATEPMYTDNGTNAFTIGTSDVTLYAVWGLEDVIEIKISDVSANLDSTVEVEVLITNNSGVAGAMLTFSYDEGIELISARGGNAWSNLALTNPASYSSPCNFLWDSVNGEDTNDGVILVLTFRVSEDAAIGSVYNIDATYTSGNIINGALEPVNADIQGGSITVDVIKGDVNNDGLVDVADVVTLRRYLVGDAGIVIERAQSDMDENGEINISDVILLRRYIVDGLA